MNRLTGFADLQELDDASLRALVEGEGDEPERVWAAWAIALRAAGGASDGGKGSAPGAVGAMLGGALSREPSAGVRAHLVLVLMGQGERVAVAILARRDPSSLVRAAACRCLARTATPGDDALNELLAHALASDESADVRVAILDGMRPDAPAYLRLRAREQLRASGLELRSVAADFVLRTRTAEENFPADLRECAQREQDPGLFKTLVRAWLLAEGVSGLVQGIASWPGADVVRVLHALAGEPLAAAHLAPLVPRQDPLVNECVARLDGHGGVDLPVGWLLAIVLRRMRAVLPPGALADADARNAIVARERAAGVAVDRLRDRLARPGLTLTSAERELARELASAIELEARDVCASVATDPLTLARYLRGELPQEAALERIRGAEEAWWAQAYAEDVDEDLDMYSFGLELLPMLREIAPKDDPGR